MNKLLTNCWIVGDVKWKKGYAHISVAESKTRARQIAEYWLAHAHYLWDKEGERDTKFFTNRGQTVDDLAKGFRQGKNMGSCGYVIRQYVLIQDGVWIRSIANGESQHITQPSRKAIEERARLEKKSAAWSDKMLKGLLSSLKK